MRLNKPVLQIFSDLGLEICDIEPDVCLYKSGLVDSADLLQIIMLIEERIESRLDLEKVLSNDFTLEYISQICDGLKDQ